jgi:hypothetical protein
MTKSGVVLDAITTLGRLRQEDVEFIASPGGIVRIYLKTNSNNK